jgi:dienelactone hydrolase
LVKSGANPDNIVVIGYCFGGSSASSKSRYESSGSRIVSWWFRPRCSPSKQCNKSASSSTHGADDLYVPAAEVTAFQQEMRYESRLGNDYADSVHALQILKLEMTTKRANAKADKRSWERMNFF